MSETLSNPGGRKRTAVHLGLLLLLTVVGYTWGIRAFPLMDPEEPRCALIVREMLRSGDWTEMRLNGAPYYDKPAPYFWITGVATKLTGSAELGGRGVSALSGIASVLIAYFLTRRVFGPRAALAAGAILATSGEFSFIARWYRMEMPTAACMWGALLCFWCMEDDFRRTGVMRRGWWYGFYACGALATLFKGPVGVGLPGLVVVIYLLASGKPKRVFEPLHLGGIILFFAIASPWYVMVSRADPNYLYEFFIKQNLTRYGGKLRDEIYYLTYAPVLILGVMPWSLWLLVSLVRMWPRRANWMRNPGVVFSWVALLVPFIFFQLSGTKLIHYILPMFLPAAVLMGGPVEGFLADAKTRRWEVAGLAVALVFCTVGPLALSLGMGDIDLMLLVPAGMSAAGLVVLAVFLKKGMRAAAFATTAVVAVGMYFFLIADDAFHVYDHRCGKALAKMIPAEDRATCRFLAFEKHPMSFEYYGDLLTEHVSESDSALVVRAFGNKRRVYVLLDDAEDLDFVKKAAGDRVYLVGQHYDMYLVTNQPPRR